MSQLKLMIIMVMSCVLVLLMTVCTDLTITTDKLMDLFESANPGEVDDIGDWLDLPQSERDKIKKNYRSPTQRKEAYLDLYVHQHPCPSWRRIAGVLRQFSLVQQADLVENTYVKGTQVRQLYIIMSIITSYMCTIGGPVPITY